MLYFHRLWQQTTSQSGRQELLTSSKQASTTIPWGRRGNKAYVHILFLPQQMNHQHLPLNTLLYFYFLLVFIFLVKNIERRIQLKNTLFFLDVSLPMANVCFTLNSEKNNSIFHLFLSLWHSTSHLTAH